jgi:putative PIN family toxin of toxin-antitoxin system
VRVILDANVIVSAAISPGGVPAFVIREWLAGAFDLIVSPKLLAEVERGLRGPKLGDRVASDRVDEILGQLRTDALVVDDPTGVERLVPADPSDDFVVALARSAQASVIVTGDRHLLEVPDLQPPAVPPRQFLESLERHGI